MGGTTEKGTIKEMTSELNWEIHGQVSTGYECETRGGNCSALGVAPKDRLQQESRLRHGLLEDVLGVHNLTCELFHGNHLW